MWLFTYLVKLEQFSRVQKEAVDFSEQSHRSVRNAATRCHVVEEHARDLIWVGENDVVTYKYICDMMKTGGKLHGQIASLRKDILTIRFSIKYLSIYLSFIDCYSIHKWI